MNANDCLSPQDARLEVLGQEECLRLLGTVPVGRIIYTRQALPAVELVNFILHDGSIVFRTSASGKLAAAIRETVVAFEADSVSSASHVGWSVTAIGKARMVTGQAAIESLDQTGLSSWVPGPHEYFVSIVPSILTGRRLC
ncbi:MAG TPA: pyridoxamine 5'-phosphate oxidase family protein [Streptosporangiaceae bacterium]|nr:pyridoxamine 5'-phosphate oxidase family protein [Streptosporangiaceae bacterium]